MNKNGVVFVSILACLLAILNIVAWQTRTVLLHKNTTRMSHNKLLCKCIVRQVELYIATHLLSLNQIVLANESIFLEVPFCYSATSLRAVAEVSKVSRSEYCCTIIFKLEDGREWGSSKSIIFMDESNNKKNPPCIHVSDTFSNIISLII